MEYLKGEYTFLKYILITLLQDLQNYLFLPAAVSRKRFNVINIKRTHGRTFHLCFFNASVLLKSGQSYSAEREKPLPGLAINS